MYIGTFIDSDSVHDLCLIRGDTLEEVKDKFIKLFENPFREIIFEESEPEYSENAKTRFTIEIDDDYWVVMEVFEVFMKRYYLIRWHGYEGVGFDLTEYGLEEDAYRKMKIEYKDYDDCDYVEDRYLDSMKAEIDTGNEWCLWEIIKEEQIL